MGHWHLAYLICRSPWSVSCTNPNTPSEVGGGGKFDLVAFQRLFNALHHCYHHLTLLLLVCRWCVPSSTTVEQCPGLLLTTALPPLMTRVSRQQTPHQTKQTRKPRGPFLDIVCNFLNIIFWSPTESQTCWICRSLPVLNIFHLLLLQGMPRPYTIQFWSTAWRTFAWSSR